MSEPLLPCPFCGNVPDANDPANFLHETGNRYAAVVCCIRGPEVRVGFYTPLEEWKDEAIAAWNKRAVMPEPEPVRTRVSNVVGSLAMAVLQRTLDEGKSISIPSLGIVIEPEPSTQEGNADAELPA